jgi:ATP-dependent DNA helicase UvrD/PcrA
LEKLEQIAAGYATRERFLAELTLDFPEATGAEAGVPLLDEDYLILSTIHSAKGQEWDVVYILNVADGYIPSDMAAGTAEQIEEERRVFGVQAENLESRHVAFFPASFELVAVGANNRHMQMFPLSAVGIYPEGFVRDLERLSRASKMSNDFSNVGVSAVGTINCTDDLSVVVVMPSIFVSIPGRRPRWIFRLRIGPHRTQEGQQDR